MTFFGHIDCDKCGHRHPSSDDCQKRKALMAGIVPRVVLMDGKPRSLFSTMEPKVMDYAQAIVEFEDRIQRACSNAEDNGLTSGDQAKELRRIADEIDGEK